MDHRRGRDARGRFKDFTYGNVKLAATELGPSTSDQKPAVGLPAGAEAGAILTSGSPDVSPFGEEASRTSEHYPSTASRSTGAPAPDDVVCEEALCSRVLLGWADGERLNELPDVDVDAVAEMKVFADDDTLRGWVLQATEERVAPAIVTSAGLYAVRHLAATLLVDDDSLAPADALISLLNAIYDRVGSRPRQWLNSLALIGKRIAAEQYLGWRTDALYASYGSPRFATEDLRALLDADGAQTLSALLRRNNSGLHEFLLDQASAHGATTAEIAAIMAEVLRRHLVDDRATGSVQLLGVFWPNNRNEDAFTPHRRWMAKRPNR